MAAIISDCGKYRYRLEREGVGLGSTAIIMVNPSTADATQDDRTIGKLRGFGERNEWGRIVVGNLFAYRATDVRELGRVADPIGPENDDHLNAILAECDQVVCAWGPISKQPKQQRNRYLNVMALIRLAGLDPLCIGQAAKCGHPKHPLMLGYDQPIEQWCAP
ncbi:hypothetical protein V474_07555 [Novosphingobium barchaimii LL02]|uniref:DUF1643 domain-containing protein n=1 Tax=Novosphingobium barchaimii LL02 TaxID=1114963 RepID=A0A0J7Y5F6_9SPHN|nr:DUF1643 domain-containing protein [Novosphingobium barchaimii]KMS59124.1 hypothetical protein V474_07555 [Novosphingobium barchaimii LL02]